MKSACILLLLSSCVFAQAQDSTKVEYSLSFRSFKPASIETQFVPVIGADEVEPLYVADGVVITSEDFRNIDVSTLESVSVIKDISITSALYGEKGRNGVIILTTKGKKFSPAKD